MPPGGENPPHPQYPQPRQHRIVFPDGQICYVARSAPALTPVKVDLLAPSGGVGDHQHSVFSPTDSSSPIPPIHPSFVPTLLPTRQASGVKFPGPEPRTTPEHQKTRHPPRSLDPCGWPTSHAPPSAALKLDSLLKECQSDQGVKEIGRTFSLAVIHKGSLVGHTYGPTSSPTTRLVSWSMAKSFTHAMLGVLVLRGLLPFDLEVEAPLPEWKQPGKRNVTMRDLVEMRSGRAWAEDYVEGDASDVIQMLFRQGASSPPTYALSRPQLHEPGSAWYYSSGTTNILCLCIARLLPKGESMHTFFRSFLDSLGMLDADPRVDGNGIFIGSSFLYASALSFARLGLLYLRDGVWEGKRLLPSGWADTARTIQAVYPADQNEAFGYGWHWWPWLDLKIGGRWGAFSMNGHEGQFVVCVPALDLVVVRLGKNKTAEENKGLLRFLARVVDAFGEEEASVAKEQGWVVPGSAARL